MNPQRDRSIIPLPSQEIAGPQIGGSRILRQMVDEVLALGRVDADVEIPRFRIGEYTWCEPDYRQILLWAEQLKMEPVDFLKALVAVNAVNLIWSDGITTKFEGGRIRSLRWDFGKLPIFELKISENLLIEEVNLSGCSRGTIRCVAEICDDPDILKLMRPNREIRLSLPTVKRLDYSDSGTQVVLTDPMRDLEELKCGSNDLTELSLLPFPNLKMLSCRGNDLTKLDLSHVPNLTDLCCQSNQLTDLELSHVPNLTRLRCSGNRLTEIDLSRVPNLTWLSIESNRRRKCDGNQVMEINLSHVPNLTWLQCDGNELSKIDLSHVPNIRGLECNRNRLTKLDISHLTSFITLACARNQLKEINLSHLPNLKTLHCSRNQLTQLDLSGVPSLTNLDCTQNDISVLDIRLLRNLVELKYDSEKTRLIQRLDQNF